MGVKGWLERKKREVEDKMLVPQKRAFLAWAEGVWGAHGGWALIELDNQREWWVKENQKSKIKRQSDKSKIENEGTNLRLVLCQPGRFEGIVQGLGKKKLEWQRVFGSRVLEVWEWCGYYEKKNQPLPLRLGLSLAEKKEMTGEVRQMLEAVLKNEEPRIKGAYPRWADQQDLDIAVWVDGRLRASVIVTGLPCQSALAKAAWRVPRDGRFKPLVPEELPEARIEITLMANLTLPLSSRDVEANEIDPSKGYRINALGRTGWYLPEVHNVLSFKHLREMLEKLALEKTKLPGVPSPGVFQIFEVMDWVESGGEVLELEGPTPRVSNFQFPIPNSEKQGEFLEYVRSIAEQAVAWLGRIQEPDGNIPHIIAADRGVVKQCSFVALGCAVHALTVYAQATRDTRARDIAERAYTYLERFAPFDALDTNAQFLARVYWARIKIARDEKIGNEMTALLQGREMAQENTLSYLQFLSLLADMTRKNKNKYLRILETEAEALYQRFLRDREKTGTQLAWYPELIRVLRVLGKHSLDGHWRKKQRDMICWYASRQLFDGAFPHSLGRTAPYTRGTGKIFEVLAPDYKTEETVIRDTFAWLEAMQYTQANTYWTDKRGQERVLGGLRHDACNREAWSDAAAHVILGAARMLKK